MSRARDAILGRLRATLAAGSGAERSGRIEAWLGEARPGPLPALPADPVETFVARARTSAARVRRVSTGAEVIGALREALGPSAGRPPLVAAPAQRLRALPWPADLRPEHRSAGPRDRACLSLAYAGIAETGSLVLLSGPQTPTGLSFLPEHFLCLLEAERILPHPEDLWARLRAEHTTPPRGVHLITGPSRTADVEQTMQLGAHGPRHVTILLWEGQPAPVSMPDPGRQP